jgi:hypothetical protein
MNCGGSPAKAVAAITTTIAQAIKVFFIQKLLNMVLEGVTEVRLSFQS